jgi:hypothetical protein
MLAFLVVGVFVVFVGAAVCFGRALASDYWDSGSDSGSGSDGGHVDRGLRRWRLWRRWRRLRSAQGSDVEFSSNRSPGCINKSTSGRAGGSLIRDLAGVTF